MDIHPPIAGEVLEWSNRRAWKARRGLKPLVGSNPTLSAMDFTHAAPTASNRQYGVPNLPKRWVSRVQRPYSIDKEDQ